MVPFDFALYCVCNNAFNLGVNQRLKLSTCQRPKLSSLATFLGAAFMVFEAIRVIAGFQDVAMMGNAIQ